MGSGLYFLMECDTWARIHKYFLLFNIVSCVAQSYSWPDPDLCYLVAFRGRYECGSSRIQILCNVCIAFSLAPWFSLCTKLARQVLQYRMSYVSTLKQNELCSDYSTLSYRYVSSIQYKQKELCTDQSAESYITSISYSTWEVFWNLMWNYHGLIRLWCATADLMSSKI